MAARYWFFFVPVTTIPTRTCCGGGCKKWVDVKKRMSVSMLLVLMLLILFRADVRAAFVIKIG